MSAIGDPVVRSVVEALNSRDGRRWFGLFSERPSLGRDIPRDLAEWCEEELFGSATAYIVSVDKVEKGGLYLLRAVSLGQVGGLSDLLEVRRGGREDLQAGRRRDQLLRSSVIRGRTSPSITGLVRVRG